MQPLTIAGRDPGGTMIAPQGRPGARALLAVLSVLSRLLPVALVCAVQLAASGPVRADPVPETMNGVPFLPIPTFEEVGLPAVHHADRHPFDCAGRADSAGRCNRSRRFG